MFKRFKTEIDRWRRESGRISTKTAAIIVEVAKVSESAERTLAKFDELSAARTARRNREIARRS